MTLTDLAPDSTLESGREHQGSTWGVPQLVALTLVLGAGVFSCAPPADPDVWWHVRTGDWILSHHALPSVDPWSLGGLGRPWMAHSWLAEVVLSLFHSAMGLRGLSVFRALGVTALVGCLAVQAFRRTSAARALTVTALAVFATLGGWGERPQLLSFLLLVPAAQLVRTAVRNGRAPLWLVPLTYLWANLHGLWFLAPALVLLGAVGAAETTPRGRRLAAVRPYGLTAVACVAAAALTPNGPGLLAQPLRVNGYGRFVTEWGPPDIHSSFGLAFFLMLGTTLAVFARRREPVALYPLLQVAFAAGLGLLYVRTIAAGAVLLTPLLAELWGRGPARPQRFPAAFVTATAATLVLLGVGGAAVVLTQEPLLPPAAPVAATKALVAAVPGEPRVLDEYAIGGWLLLFAPHAHPAIDGRAEVYPLRYVSDYIAALKMSGDWRSTVERLHANVALLHPETPLVNGLRDTLHWRTVYHDDTWLVLVPPTSPPA